MQWDRFQRTRLLATAAAVCLAGSAAAATAEAPAVPTPLDLARQLNQAFVQVADQVSPSVVVISVAHRADYVDPYADEEEGFDRSPRDFLRPPEDRRDRPRPDASPRPRRVEPDYDSQGSGVIIREDGYLLTNRHVVDGAERIRVRLADGREFEADVRGVDSRSDLAVLKIAARGLKVARLGDSGQTRVGEFAIAIGAPFELDYSVTVGHISAKGRSQIIDDPTADQDFLQTDANINPGNSGGPLVNLQGEVVGINTLIRGLHTGIGFAIPSNLAKEVSGKLIAEGRFVRSWLGIGIRALREAPEFREWNPGITDGVVVIEIKQDGPARNSELKASDVITAVDGRPVANAQQLKNEVRAKSVGQTVLLDVQRSGQALKVKLKTDTWQDDTLPVLNRTPGAADGKSKPFGLGVEALTEATARQLGVAPGAGVAVTEVRRGSEAERAGLRPGCVITEVNRRPVTSPKQFREAMSQRDPKKGVLVVFVARDAVRCEILQDTGE